MSEPTPGPDLVEIAREAEVEIVVVETLRGAEVGGLADLGTAELGYYEAELLSLRDAATGEAEALES